MKKTVFTPGKVVIAAAALMIFLAGCSRLKSTETPAPKTIGELKAAIAATLRKYHIPGAGIALVSTDKVIWAGGIGKADLAAKRDVTADTMFRIGSITKGFVALSILKLQERGKISLDAQLSDLAPEIPIVNPWNRTDPIRVVNLLEQTAGFNDFSLAEFYDFDAPPEKPLGWTLQHFPGPQHVRWRPGTRFSYSNPDYGLAGYLVEKVSGQPCEDYIADNILRPLKMDHSDLRLTPEVKAALAQGYEKNPPQPVPYLPILLRPAGEMKSSPAEMARFVRLMLNRGQLDGIRIVSAESIERMETPTSSIGAKAGLLTGYGLGNNADPSHRILTYGHDGGLDGFLSRYAYMPAQAVGYFFSINTWPLGGGFKEIDKLLFDYVTRDIASPPQPRRTALPPDIGEWAGFYEIAAPRFELERFADLLVGGVAIYVHDGKLYRRPMIAGAKEMIPVGGHLFRTSKEPSASAVLAIGDVGQPVMVTAFTPRVPIPVYFEKTPAFWPITRLILIILIILIILAILTVASSVLFAFIWIPRKLLGRMKSVEHLSVRVLPLLAVLAFVLFILASAFATPYPRELAKPDLKTITICAASIVFAILSVLAMVLAIGSFRFQMNRVVHIHSMLVSISCLGMTWYLTYWGLIGLRTWAPW
jgi:CubicO group peptidase (beta-lactamase class C family)